jgi:hypothetical protein
MQLVQSILIKFKLPQLYCKIEKKPLEPLHSPNTNKNQLLGHTKLPAGNQFHLSRETFWKITMKIIKFFFPITYTVMTRTTLLYRSTSYIMYIWLDFDVVIVFISLSNRLNRRGPSSFVMQTLDKAAEPNKKDNFTHSWRISWLFFAIESTRNQEQ